MTLSSGGGTTSDQRMPPPIVSGYCFELSIKVNVFNQKSDSLGERSVALVSVED